MIIIDLDDAIICRPPNFWELLEQNRVKCRATSSLDKQQKWERLRSDAWSAGKRRHILANETAH